MFAQQGRGMTWVRLVMLMKVVCYGVLLTALRPFTVRVSNVKFHNIRGKSTKKVAVDLQCNSAMPCQDIDLSKIDLTFDGAEAASNCSNAKEIAFNGVKPLPCF